LVRTVGRGSMLVLLRLWRVLLGPPRMSGGRDVHFTGRERAEYLVPRA
jgi:hypothetical protein